MPGHGIVFKGGKPGHHKIYLDNLWIRHGDGTTTSIWTSAKDTSRLKIKDSELFIDIRVRSIPVEQAK
jgi:hypothetical protein